MMPGCIKYCLIVFIYAITLDFASKHTYRIFYETQLAWLPSFNVVCLNATTNNRVLILFVKTAIVKQTILD